MISKFCNSSEIKCEHKDASLADAIRCCPCQPSQEIVRYYYGEKDKYILVDEYCECSNKTQNKGYLNFSLLCKDCAASFLSCVQTIKGLPQRNYKWTFKTWVHQEFKAMNNIIAAIAIPNSDQFVAITGKSLPNLL